MLSFRYRTCTVASVSTETKKKVDIQNKPNFLYTVYIHKPVPLRVTCLHFKTTSSLMQQLRAKTKTSINKIKKNYKRCKTAILHPISTRHWNSKGMTRALCLAPKVQISYCCRLALEVEQFEKKVGKKVRPLPKVAGDGICGFCLSINDSDVRSCLLRIAVRCTTGLRQEKSERINTLNTNSITVAVSAWELKWTN